MSEREPVDRVIAEELEPREPSKPAHMPSRKRSSSSNRKAGSEKVTVESATKKAASTRAKAIPKAGAKGVEEGTVTALQVMAWFMPPREIWPIDKSDPGELEALKQFSESLASLINRLPEPVRVLIMRAASGGGWGKDILGVVKGVQALMLPRLMMLKLYNADPAGWQTMPEPGPAMEREPVPAAYADPFSGGPGPNGF